MMRRYTIFVLSLLAVNMLSAQWEVKYPNPYDLIFQDVYFTDNNNGWISGNGFIMNTTDGGNNWIMQYSDTAKSFQRIQFSTPTIGWSYTNYDDIFITTNGGEMWNLVNSFQNSNVRCFNPLGEQNCWVGTESGIYHTSDQGISWDLQFDDSGVRDISFVNESMGWAIIGAKILLGTINGGDIWDTISNFENGNLMSVTFLSEEIGYLFNSAYPDYEIFKTSDGGMSWNEVFSTNTYLSAFYFQNPDTGYIFLPWELFRTTDGGVSWDNIELRNEIRFLKVNGTDDKLWGIGNNASFHSLQVSEDLGTSWTSLYPQTITTNSLYSVDFINSQKGWAVGNYGTIIYTEDSGETWAGQSSGTYKNLKEVQFISQTTGWIIGDSGTFLRTQNGGSDWEDLSLNQDVDLIGFYFINENQGWIISDIQLYKTENGGETWQEIQTFNELGAVFYSSELNGWVLGRLGEEKGLFSTLDGGLNWSLDISIQSWVNGNNNILFVDQMNGWIAASWSDMATGGSVKYRTTDGGQTWTELDLWYYRTLGFSFSDSIRGFAISIYNDFQWKIIETNDGGNTWQDSYIPDFLDWGYDFGFGSSDIACVVGGGGLIMIWNGPTWGIDNPVKKSNRVLQIFPNPTKSSLTIELPMQPSKNTSLTISNTNGQQIITQAITEPQTQIDISHLPAGIYIVKVWNDKDVLVQKVIRQ